MTAYRGLVCARSSASRGSSPPWWGIFQHVAARRIPGEILRQPFGLSVAGEEQGGLSVLNGDDEEELLLSSSRNQPAGGGSTV
jgi:hypothetical protein